MKFNPDTRTLELERKDCVGCSHQDPPGTMPAHVPCSVCQGTGNGPRGGKGRCRSCFNGKTWDHSQRVTCDRCGGNYQDADLETFCDRAPVQAIQAMPMFFLPLDRPNTWNESYIGMGTIYSCSDYGTRWQTWVGQSTVEAANDVAQALMMEARESITDGSVQATKVVKPYERGDTVAHMHDALIFTLTQTGYQVRAMSDLPANFRENCLPEQAPASA